jgi:tripartite-type tricarboxylate transporter receptor subunit TctC
VPYKGVPPGIQDLLGKQIDLSFVPRGGSTADLVESGKVRVFGSSGATPSARLPKVPPLSALDLAFADFVHTSWAAVFVPRTTSEAGALRLQRALAAALADADVQAYMASTGGDRAAAMSPADLDRFYDDEIRLYQALAKEIGVTAQ